MPTTVTSPTVVPPITLTIQNPVLTWSDNTTLTLPGTIAVSVDLTKSTMTATIADADEATLLDALMQALVTRAITPHT